MILIYLYVKYAMGDNERQKKVDLKRSKFTSNLNFTFILYVFIYVFNYYGGMVWVQNV